MLIYIKTFEEYHNVCSHSIPSKMQSKEALSKFRHCKLHTKSTVLLLARDGVGLKWTPVHKGKVKEQLPEKQSRRMTTSLNYRVLKFTI